MLTHPAILERLIGPQRGDFSPELARYVIGLDFQPSDHARYTDLSERAQRGGLSAEEQSELDDYLSVNDLLTILKSKARLTVARHNSAA